MEQNFEFNWPGNEPLKPKKEKKKPDFKRAGKTVLCRERQHRRDALRPGPDGQEA